MIWYTPLTAAAPLGLMLVVATVRALVSLKRN